MLFSHEISHIWNDAVVLFHGFLWIEMYPLTFVCFSFPPILPPSHEKHIGVSWLTTTADRVDFQHHLLFCFITFSTSLFSCNTNCTASDLKWNSRCSLIYPQKKKGIIGSEKYWHLNSTGLSDTVSAYFYGMHAKWPCRLYPTSSQVESGFGS